MLRLDRRLLHNVDWPLLGAALAIVVLSVICLSSLGLGRGGSGLALRQLLWVGVGIGALLVVVTFDYRSFVRAAPALYLVGLGLLVTVFVLGRMVSGARRWIHLGPLTFQPSELFKLIFILTLAGALTHPGRAGGGGDRPHAHRMVLLEAVSAGPTARVPRPVS